MSSPMFDAARYHSTVVEQKVALIAELKNKILTESVPDYRRVMWEVDLQHAERDLKKHRKLVKRYGG